VLTSENDSTPFDLRFRLLGTSIRVPLLFWIFGALFGYFYMRYREQVRGEDLGWSFVALWIGWLFVSSLAHDLGHIVVARLAGRRGQIVLGGQPSWDAPASRRWQRIAIAAAGPCAGFLFYGLAKLIKEKVVPLFGVKFFVQQPVLTMMINESMDMLVFISLFWNLLNLLPIWTLDGGEISLEVFSGLSRANGYRFAFGLSSLLAAAACAYSVMVAFRPGLPYLEVIHAGLKGFHPGLMAFFTGLMAIQSISALVKAERERRGESNAVKSNAVKSNAVKSDAAESEESTPW
jgi:Zn-dependent protease